MVVIDRKGIRYPFHSFAMARCEYLEAMTRHAWLESEEGEVTIDEEPEDVKLFHQCEPSSLLSSTLLMR